MIIKKITITYCAKSQSTETASADGEVEVYVPLPGVVYKAKAETSANLATGILLDCVTFDLSSGKYLIDENEGSDENAHGLRIVGYDSDSGEVYFEIKDEATLRGASVA